MDGTATRPVTEYTPRVGDYFLTGLPGVAGLLIRIGQAVMGDWSRYTHAGTYVGVVDGVRSCVEATGQGLKLVPLADVLQRPLLAWSTDDIPEDARALIATLALADLGAAYGWLTYAQLVADQFGLKATRLRAYVATSTNRICSQSVDYYRMVAGVHMFNDGRQPGDVSPGNLAQVGTVWHARTGPYLEVAK